MEIILILFLSIFALIALFLFMLWVFTYNRFIAIRNRAHTARSGIDVQLKKRYDLIPQLNTVVTHYLAYESDLLSQIAALRTKANHAQIEQLLVRIEKYPELQGEAQVKNLMKHIRIVEDDIAAARTIYNRAATAHNTAISIFPFNLIARTHQEKPFPLFTD